MTMTTGGAGLQPLRGAFERGTVAGCDDGQLLARFAADRRDEAAFAALVARHGPMVWATARAVLRHEQDAEDAFQATFLALARRAGSVRAGASLAAWLHRVARRAAVAASRAARSRHRQELALLDAPRPVAAEEGPEPDLVAAVRVAVARLPERDRLAVVLCDLEGLTYAEAAARLGWPEPTLRGRLARARGRLRARLARHAPGSAPASAVGLLARPVVPGALARATVVMALGRDVASTRVLTIAVHLSGGTLMHHGKILTVALLATLGSAGFAVAFRPPAAPPSLPPRPTSPPAIALAEAPPADPATLRGRVVDPDGRPVAGAAVRTLGNFNHPNPLTVATTGPDGSFALPAPPPLRQAAPGSPARRLVASALGFGPGFGFAPLDGDATVRLVPPGPPIEGRIVDEAGRPVVGARVAAGSVLVPLDVAGAEAGTLAAWLARPESDTLHAGTQSLPADAAATADADGRFRIDGLGAERVVLLGVRHPGIQDTTIYVATRPGNPVTVSRRVIDEPARTVIQPGRFEMVAWPSRPLVGTVTDAATGRPLAGWKVAGGVAADNYWRAGDVTSTTDVDGRYALAGLGRARRYRVSLSPPADQPYLPAGYRRVEAPDGPEPVRLDHVARRGVVVRGRVTDRSTGAPVAGYLDAEALATNPHVAKFAGYADSGPNYRYPGADGRFAVVLPPGPGVIAFSARDMGRYRLAQGAEGLPGYDAQFRMFRTVGRDLLPVNYQALAAVDPPADAEAVDLDLAVDAPSPVALTILDPEGRPLGGVEVDGTTEQGIPARFSESATVTLTGLAPGRTRRVIARHVGRKLVGVLDARADAADRQVLRLGPWGELRGRVVHDDGTPAPEVAVGAGRDRPDRPRPEPVGSWPPGGRMNTVPTDAEGRFHAVGLVPGHHYAGAAEKFGEFGIGDLFDDVAVGPGEVKDLGDLKIRPFRRP